MGALYYHVAEVRVGGSHLRRGHNGQDHAVVRSSEDAVVLAVADGIGGVRDGGSVVASRNEVASWLAAELAAKTALAHIGAGGGFDSLPDAVGAALHGCFHPLWGSLGRRVGEYGLGTTLLLAVLTEERTQIWLSGDGYWGVLLPPQASPSAVTLHDRALAGAGPNVLRFTGGVHESSFDETITTIARRSDPSQAIASLRPVLVCEGQVLAAYVATDGLRDEPRLMQMFGDCPIRRRQTFQDLLVRGEQSDDLAVAWACTRVPGLLGEVEL